MAQRYTAVQWNRNKLGYDLMILLGVALYVGVFMMVATATGSPSARSNADVLIISAFGACAFFMLHVILAIGPLARLSPIFLPLLYNRRHLGVIFFLIALGHATLATIWYHGYGVLNPIVSLFVSNPRYDAIDDFPFESLGVGALVIFFVLAATSHDFWLRNLSPAVWKTLHMFIYFAYALVVLHVLLGAASEHGGSGIYAWATGVGAAIIAGLHLAAGALQFVRDKMQERLTAVGWIDAGTAIDIPENCARIVSARGGEGIAVFRYDGKVSAVSNRCPHQMGPLGEGRIIDGRITCPWHGFQFNPATGRATPPFTDHIQTYAVRMANGRVFVNPSPDPSGTSSEPAKV